MKRATVVVAMVASLSLPVCAAVLEISGEIAGAYDASWNPVPVPDFTEPYGSPVVLVIDQSFNIRDFSEGQAGFGGLAMAIHFDGGLSTVPEVGFAGDSSTIDFNGELPGGVAPLWFLNEDSGEDRTDQKVIAVAVSKTLWQGVDDPRLSMGRDQPQYFGTSYVMWDGASAFSIEAEIGQFGTVDTDGYASTDNSGTALGYSIAWDQAGMSYSVLTFDMATYRASWRPRPTTDSPPADDPAPPDEPAPPDYPAPPYDPAPPGPDPTADDTNDAPNDGVPPPNDTDIDSTYPPGPPPSPPPDGPVLIDGQAPDKVLRRGYWPLSGWGYEFSVLDGKRYMSVWRDGAWNTSYFGPPEGHHWDPYAVDVNSDGGGFYAFSDSSPFGYNYAFPEPATVTLLMLGGCVLLLRRR